MNRLDRKGILHDMAFDQAHPQLARKLRSRRRDRRETTIPGAQAHDAASFLRAADEQATVERETRENSVLGKLGYYRLPHR